MAALPEGATWTGVLAFVTPPLPYPLQVNEFAAEADGAVARMVEAARRGTATAVIIFALFTSAMRMISLRVGMISPTRSCDELNTREEIWGMLSGQSRT